MTVLEESHQSRASSQGDRAVIQVCTGCNRVSQELVLHPPRATVSESASPGSSPGDSSTHRKQVPGPRVLFNSTGPEAGFSHTGPNQVHMRSVQIRMLV